MRSVFDFSELCAIDGGSDMGVFNTEPVENIDSIRGNQIPFDFPRPNPTLKPKDSLVADVPLPSQPNKDDLVISDAARQAISAIDGASGGEFANTKKQNTQDNQSSPRDDEFVTRREMKEGFDNLEAKISGIETTMQEGFDGIRQEIAKLSGNAQ